MLIRKVARDMQAHPKQVEMRISVVEPSPTSSYSPAPGARPGNMPTSPDLSFLLFHEYASDSSQVLVNLFFLIVSVFLRLLPHSGFAHVLFLTPKNGYSKSNIAAPAFDGSYQL
jgi:hypothetical protein